MNNATHATRPSSDRIHAEDSATAAYLVARKLGASPEAAMSAHRSAYAAALAER